MLPAADAAREGAALDLAVRREERTVPAGDAAGGPGAALEPARVAPESRPVMEATATAGVRADLSRERGSVPDAAASLPSERPEAATPAVAGAARGVGSSAGPAASPSSAPREPTLAAEPLGVSGAAV